MQAMLMFALFGAMMALVGGIISTGTDSIQQLREDQINQTVVFFSNVEDIIINEIVPQNMELPYQSCPNGGGSLGATNVRSYLCQTQLARLVTWSGASNGMQDPWKNDFTGFVVRREVPIYASAPSNVVSVPVTAMALVSAGPDRRLGTALQASLASLSASSDIRDVLRISGPNPTTCTVAIEGSCDDIVHTFTDQQAQFRRWQKVQAAVDKIAAATLRDYQQQFEVFKSQLPAIFASNTSGLFDASGNLVLTSANINVWQGAGTNPPTLASIDLNSSTERLRLGVDQEFDLITENLVNGGSNLAVSFVVSSSPDGFENILTINLSNASSPWGLWETQGGTLSYQKIIETNVN